MNIRHQALFRRLRAESMPRSGEAALVILRMDTPGGLDTSMRDASLIPNLTKPTKTS